MVQIFFLNVCFSKTVRNSKKLFFWLLEYSDFKIVGNFQGNVSKYYIKCFQTSMLRVFKYYRASLMPPKASG